MIPDASADSLIDFITANVEQGSVIHTDGWTGYDATNKNGYVHEVTVLRRSGKKAHECLPRVHLVVVAPEKMASWNSSGCCWGAPSRLLLGRVHVPFQQAKVNESW